MNSLGEKRRRDLGISPVKRTEKDLGKLVQFEGRGKERGAAKPDRPAEILIFTGVRYERDNSTAPTKPTASSGAKRKRG